jgi:hypothetical protein
MNLKGTGHRRPFRRQPPHRRRYGRGTVQAIGLPVQRYSIDRPMIMVEDLMTAVANLVPLPVGWQAHFSALLLRLQNSIGIGRRC